MEVQTVGNYAGSFACSVETVSVGNFQDCAAHGYYGSDSDSDSGST